MKFSLLLVALLGANQAATVSQHDAKHTLGCDEALEVSEEELGIQLDFLSRRLDVKYYENAMKIYDELKKMGKNPKVSVHTWELYDKAFSFPRVRRYDLVQQHMDLIQHFQDNLNQNFTNSLALTNFLRAAKAA